MLITLSLLSAVFLLPDFGLIVVYTYLPPLSLARAIPPFLAASVLSVLSAVSILGRTGSFFLVKWRGARRSLPIAVGLMTVSVFGLSLGFNLVSLYALAVAFGLGYGLWIALMPAATAEAFGMANYGRFWGIINGWGGIGGLIGPIAAGELLDFGARDLLVLTMAGLVLFAAFTISIVARFGQKKWKKQQ